MAATIYTLPNLTKEPAEVVEIATQVDAILFDARSRYATKGTVRTRGSARHLASLYADYEEAPYLLSQTRPNLTKQIILARPKPILVLTDNERDAAIITEFLQELRFIVTPYSNRRKAQPLPLFDNLQDFSSELWDGE